MATEPCWHLGARLTTCGGFLVPGREIEPSPWQLQGATTPSQGGHWTGRVGEPGREPSSPHVGLVQHLPCRKSSLSRGLKSTDPDTVWGLNKQERESAGIHRPGTPCTRAVSSSPKRPCGLRMPLCPQPQARPCGNVGAHLRAHPSARVRWGSPAVRAHSPGRPSFGPREARKGPLCHLLGFETAVKARGLADLGSNPVSIAT